MSQVSGVWKSRIRVPAWPGAGEALVLVCRRPSSACVLQTSSLWLFLESTNPVHDGSTLMTQFPLEESHVLVLRYWKLGFQHMNLGGHKHSVHRKEYVIEFPYICVFPAFSNLLIFTYLFIFIFIFISLSFCLF